MNDNRLPEGGKSSRGGSKMSSRRLQEGSWTTCGLHLAAKAARMLTLGGSGGALGALLAVLVAVLKRLEPSWGVPGRSWAPLEGRFGTSQEPIC